MYITFKIDGRDGGLSIIFSNGKFYKVPDHYNVYFNKKSMDYYGIDSTFDEAIEQIMERCNRDERNEK